MLIWWCDPRHRLRVASDDPLLPRVSQGDVGTQQSNFIFQESVAKIIIKLLNKKGVINVGGPSQSIYKFAKKNKKNVKKIYSKGEFPRRTDMDLKKLNNILK